MRSFHPTYFLHFLFCVGCLGVSGALPDFTKFPAQTYSAKKLEKIDWESHPKARTYRTRLKELIGTNADFAGHYKVLEVGGGTMASQIFLVDVENGKVYLAPFVACLGVKYALSSRLLFENDPDAVQDYVRGLEGKRPDWLQVRAWIWKERTEKLELLP